MIDSAVPLGSSNGTVYEVLNTGFHCDISEILPLHHLSFGPHRPEILHAVDAVNTTNGGLERRDIFQISPHEYNTLVRLGPAPLWCSDHA